jgi:hypothetical protein
MSLTERYISEADPPVLNTIDLLSPEQPPTGMISKNNELDPLLPRHPIQGNRRRWLGLATPALIIPFVLSSSLAVSHHNHHRYLCPAHFYFVPSVGLLWHHVWKFIPNLVRGSNTVRCYRSLFISISASLQCRSLRTHHLRSAHIRIYPSHSKLHFCSFYI